MFTSFPVANAIVGTVLSQGACQDDEMEKGVGKQLVMPDAALLDLRGLRGRMSGCGDIPASWGKEGKSLKLALSHTGKVCAFVMYRIAGFRPGGRATFVSAKVAKTSDAPPS